MNGMTLGQKIRELRLALQLTQKELAGDFITRNMLSQIENDQATPSMKTMEFLARQLGKSIGYFLDDDHTDLTLSNVIARLILSNEENDYEGSISVIEEQALSNPAFMRNKMMMDIYMNSYMNMGNKHMKEGTYKEAKACYEKILRYENDLMILSDTYLYKVYAQLSEVNTYLGDIELAHSYHKKGKILINKLLAGREVQSLYMKLMEGENLEILDSIGSVDTSAYDAYSLARYNMVVGSAYYNDEQYLMAVNYLEKAIGFYEQKTYNSITAMIYDEMSQCYSKLDDYKKAYDYLQLAQVKKS